MSSVSSFTSPTDKSLVVQRRGLTKTYKDVKLQNLDLHVPRHSICGFLFSGLMLPNVLPEWTILILPWPFAKLARAQMAGKSIPFVWLIPVIATIVWTILFLMIALWRFECEEF